MHEAKKTFQKARETQNAWIEPRRPWKMDRVAHLRTTMVSVPDAEYPASKYTRHRGRGEAATPAVPERLRCCSKPGEAPWVGSANDCHSSSEKLDEPMIYAFSCSKTRSI
ncbi:hypothetical protein WOLCODRAFT_26498 [Wolfiporia cocos MD-104 SS10]|uniref:Uncharacterized protein n=1 Tax=Wolfiporia cocos (strain MD-104) TaxID=742152 RepID=A0A2H3JYY1_WOLCO|nr:hypothetical protein WOLCODRAFT_26498 [Wolfiporia cocos MD-104 SS10]